MGRSTQIRRAAGEALRSSAGWLPSVCAWAAWFVLEKVALTPLVLLGPLCLVGVYYFLFAKIYGMSLLSMAVLRGEPRFRYAFAGFGHGWRTLGVHLWISWRLFLPALSLLALLVAVVGWTSVSAAPSAEPAFGRQTVQVLLGSGALGLALAAWLLTRWYRYRLSYYVFVDHVDWTLSAVVDEAARLMEGRRGDLFLLDLWYVGASLLLLAPGVWQLIAGTVEFCRADGDLLELQAVLRSGVKDLPPGLGTLLQGVQMLGFGQLAVLLLVQPAWTTAHAAFYEDLLDRDEAAAPSVPPSSESDPNEAAP